MELYEIKSYLPKLKEELASIINEDDVNELNEEKKSCEDKMLRPGFYDDHELVTETTAKLSTVNKLLDLYKVIVKQLAELEEFLTLSLDEIAQLATEINDEFSSLQHNIKELRVLTLLNEEYDGNDALLEIHMGAGGTESQDWVDMLYKMYVNYAKKKGFKVDVVTASYASDVGIKSIMFKISGNYAYGLLKNERGVHRLVRISPFDSNKRRHTTFALVNVSPILDQMNDVVIDEKDLIIDTFRASGAGGQSVNTTDSAVRITHVPTKIVVTCQNERSQLRNKEEALKVLKSKLLQLEIDKQEALMRNLKGENIDINFGSQIRSYIFHPYQMVKDHRSKYESSNPQSLLEGNIDDVMASVLQYSKER